ncbi:MAG: hypothetical protein GFH27_549283n101 [Chloroflexi bacterium AL-W]|nr:hypothetical protein [Chloroflexi bacterium AL-N1]NOK64778.1 hypothetical protein [Chloroflexi bacterium AL-N10]NOK80222.1 hypothetical protein [Chloroflexi bacterium AL-W]NOK86735.1 hypothetical protein [Chloroflexi bacterium AL-N15]
MQKPLITKSQLITDLQNIGVQAGDTLMLHASVKAIGWVVGGPRVVLEALLDVLSAEGTLMMLASWEGNPYDLSQWSEAEQQRWLDECPPFDPATSPADHREMSILSEYLRTWPNACRSAHPLASFVAVGRHAAWLTETHPMNYNLGHHSPLARLCEADGRILLLGASFGTLTFLHHAEHLVDIPDKRIDRYKVPILQDDQKVWIEIEEFDTTNGIADFGSDNEDYFDDIGQVYIAANRCCVARVGAAQTYLIQANDIKEFAMQWMQQHYRGT